MQLLELVKCGCTTACKRKSCSCRKSKLSCTASCMCTVQGVDCCNPFKVNIEGDEEHDSEDDDD